MAEPKRSRIHVPEAKLVRGGIEVPGGGPGAGSNTVYNVAKAALMGVPSSGPGSGIAQISLTGDTIKIALMQSSYTVAPEHDFMGDISADELNVTGYAPGFGGAGRATLGSKTLVANDTADNAAFDAADPATWTLATGQTIGGAVVYKHITSDAASPLICYLAFTNTPTNGSTISIQFHSTGVLILA